MQPQIQPQPERPQQSPAPQPNQPATTEETYAPQPNYYAQPQAAPATASPPVASTLTEQFPVDYLNQISGTAQVKKVKPVLVFGLIGAVLLLVAGALFFFIQSASSPNANAQIYALQARLDTLNKVTSEQGKHLMQNELSSINSTLGASLTSMTTNLASYAKARGLASKDKAATSANATEKKYYEALSKKLDDAYLTGTLDRSYATEIKYQLSILKSKMQLVKTAANSKTYNEFYASNVTSVDTVVTLLSKFQNTK